MFGNDLDDGAKHRQYKREGHERITGQGDHDKGGVWLRRFPMVEQEGCRNGSPRDCRVDIGRLFLWDGFQPPVSAAEAETAADFEYREPKPPRRYGEHPTSRTERLGRR